MDRPPANTASQAGKPTRRALLTLGAYAATSTAALLAAPPTGAQPHPLLVNPIASAPATERQWRLISLDDQPSPASPSAATSAATATAAASPTALPTSTGLDGAERPWRLVTPQAPSTPPYQLPANKPIAVVRKPRPFMLAPYLGGGVPSGFVAEWGDYYITGSAGTPGKLRDGNVDGSVGAGIGFGDAQKFLALELDWGIGSIKNFNTNGGFDVSLGRVLTNTPTLLAGLAGGVYSLYSYGDNEPGVDEATPYGALSLVTPLRPNDPNFRQFLQLSVGAGGADFAPIDAQFEGPDVGVFASVGVEITRNTGLSAAWSGRGVNAGLSYVPFVELPLVVNLLGVDLFNQTPYGTIGILSVTWGGNFFEGVF